MSGNATNQEFASLCLKANAALNRPNQKNQIDLDGPAVGWEYLVCANRLLHAGDCGMESFASLSVRECARSGGASRAPATSQVAIGYSGGPASRRLTDNG